MAGLGCWLRNEVVSLEPASGDNVDLLIEWTLDPIAQGPYKRVPEATPDGLRALFLHAPDRWYFLIRRARDAQPLGRFYYRAWRFQPDKIDWELNLLIADPAERGKGYGMAVQALAADFLLQRQETHSVFAYTFETNVAERRALQKAGFKEVGPMPHPYYQVQLPPEQCVLYVCSVSPSGSGIFGIRCARDGADAEGNDAG
jgi:RimJ/RimL family protein N-acetyltransferase